MADQVPQLTGISTARPRQADGDLPGYRPKQYLKEKSPYVRDKQGMIWMREPWMNDMGDVLEACWEAPPKPKIMVANSPLDIAHYGKQAPQRKEAEERPKRRAKAKKRKSSKRKPPMPAPYHGPDTGTGSTPA